MSRILFLGDVFLPEPIEVLGMPDNPFILNLEAPIAEDLTPASGKILLRTSANHLFRTFGRDPLAVCLANNHMLDYGPQGLHSTLVELDRCGISSFGVRRKGVNQNRPVVVEVAGTRVGLLAYLCTTTNPASGAADWINFIDINLIATDIEACRGTGADRVVVQLHWGDEGCSVPKPADVELARNIIDAGADLIIGHHAHCVQDYEVYRGRYICYGLGNCIFPEFDIVESGPALGPRKTRRGYWFRWNNKSMAVSYDPLSNSCNLIAFRLEKDQRLVCLGERKFRKAPSVAAGYPRYYARARRWGTIRYSVARFFRDPKLPNARHLKLIGKWFTKL